MISALALRNFKRFRVTEFALRPLTVLTGLNGTGKSTAIQALLLARQASEDDAPVVQLNERYGLSLGEAQDSALPRTTTLNDEEWAVTRRARRLVGLAAGAGAVAAGAAGCAGLAAAGYVGLVTGAVPVDLGVGRRTRPLRPQVVDIDAPREVVFDLIAQPYLGRPTRALQEKIRVLERGSDMVLAAHFTPAGRRLVAQTVETVRFTRPERVDFRLVRGPVPHVTEEFVLTTADGGTRLEYRGRLGTDLWAVGDRWGAVVARQWERVVADTFGQVKAEAERRRRP